MSGTLPTRARASQLQLLGRDILQSLRNWRFWIFLGWNDIAKQYRRSFIGPIWITLNTAIFIVAFGMVGAQLFRMSVEDYLPYFCTGHILFGFMSAMINEGCQVYVSAEAFLKQTRYPKMAFVFRVVWRNSILLAHNLLVVFAVLIWAGRFGTVHWPALFAALALTLLSACLVVALIGAVATRFRDIPLIVASIMQISFFVTPVMWRAEQLTERAQLLVHLNPLASYLEILRRPLLGQSPDPQSWLTAGGLLVVLAIVYVILYRAVRRHIVYWL